MLRVDHRLRILSPVRPIERRRRTYTVRAGDTWSKIASHFNVDRDKLRKDWNPEHDQLTAGDRLQLWVEVEDLEADPTHEQAADEEPELVASIARGGQATRPDAPPPTFAPRPRSQQEYPIVHVEPTALSAGSAAHGRLLHGIQLPENESLYNIRNPDNTWGSSHAIEQLQLAIAAFRRNSGFSRELVIEDMSQQHGGRFLPHHSHRSGRDVDVELPLKGGVPVGTIPRQASVVNWDAAWALVKALIATGEVRYIFLSRTRQGELYRAAQRAGASEQELEEYIQYPHHNLTALVRHSHGHEKHIHVRFVCASYETDCSD
jgi:hypothetical protein